MVEIFTLAGVCVLIGLMGRSVKERVAVSIIIGCVIAPLAILMAEMWSSEHSGPQLFLELGVYVALYWRLLIALTGALVAGSLLVGLARKYVVKEVG